MIVGSNTLQFLPSGNRMFPVPEGHVHESQDLVGNNLLRVGFDSFLKSIEG